MMNNMKEEVEKIDIWHPKFFHDFAIETNKIEGITDSRSIVSMAKALSEFMREDELTFEDVVRFAEALGGKLRDKVGMDVRVGGYVPPHGSPMIPDALRGFVERLNISPSPPYVTHKDFERLHPFTDGNGRTGRAIWLWQTLREDSFVPLGFLHTWYYQSLSEGR